MKQSRRMARILLPAAACFMATAMLNAAQSPNYEQARWDPIHFKPAIDQASDEQ